MEKNDFNDGWTIKTLKEHMESILREHDRRFEQRFQAQESALKAALAAKDNGSSSGLEKIAIGVAATSGLMALAALFMRK